VRNREKNRPQAAEAGETACPTIDSKQRALVALAVSPADFDFFAASDGVCSAAGLLKG
jgi:hypothetical protein